jgi:hypothetical protein
MTTLILVNSTTTCSFDKPGCTNPIKLDHTAFINTAASVSLLTKKTLAASTPQPKKVQISIIQPRRDCMMTTHAINLLLRKLPPEARLAHQLPGLVNNLLSVAVLCDAGCEVFFSQNRLQSHP